MPSDNQEIKAIEVDLILPPIDAATGKPRLPVGHPYPFNDGRRKVALFIAAPPFNKRGERLRAAYATFVKRSSERLTDSGVGAMEAIFNEMASDFLTVVKESLLLQYDAAVVDPILDDAFIGIEDVEPILGIMQGIPPAFKVKAMSGKNADAPQV